MDLAWIFGLLLAALIGLLVYFFKKNPATAAMVEKEVGSAAQAGVSNVEAAVKTEVDKGVAALKTEAAAVEKKV